MLTEINIKKITQPKLPKMKNEVTKIYNEQGKTLPERVQMSEVPITNVFFTFTQVFFAISIFTMIEEMTSACRDFFFSLNFHS